MAEGEIERGSQGISAWGALIMAVGMSTLWITVGAMVIESSRDGDFLNLYTGATLAWEGRFVQTHDPDVQFAKEKTLYLDLLQRDDLKELSPGLEVMVNVHAITANLLQESMVLSSVLVAVVVGLALVSDWQAPLWHWVAASLTGCILVPPHAYPYDASILLLAVLLVMVRFERPLPPLGCSDPGGSVALFRTRRRRAVENDSCGRDPASSRGAGEGELPGGARGPGFVKKRLRISKARSVLRHGTRNNIGTEMGKSMTSGSRKSRVPFATVGLAAVFSCFWMALGSQLVETAREHDFLAFYTGGLLAREGRFADLYDRDLQKSRQREIVPYLRELVPYIRPPVYALVLAPLSFFSLHTAFWIWIGLHALLLLGCWRWASRKFGPDAIIYGALYLPTAIGLAHGQDGIFWLCVAIAAYRLAEAGKDARAGAVLGLALVKFHLLTLVPVAMLLQRRWKMLRGFCFTGVALALSSFALIGVGGVEKYVALVSANDLATFNPSPERLINVYALGVNFGFDFPLLRVLLVLFVIGAVVMGARQGPLWVWLSISLTGSLLVAPFTFGYDAAILLLPLWLVLFRSQSGFPRIVALTLAVPFPFFCSMLGAPWSAVPAAMLVLFLIALTRERVEESG